MEFYGSYQLEMSSYPSFNELADQIYDKKHFHEIITRQQKFFEINPYKIEKLYPETAKKIYSQILNKYEVTKEFKVCDGIWQENQRRVFVWYIILLVDVQSISISNTNQIKWDQLSQVFFGKTASFLEFQFVNILKSKRKITWNSEEDTILLQAMQKQKAGKWNQVSKRIFYESEGRLFKSPKHCRQRWFNHLDQSKNKGSWALQEDYTIFRFIVENGKRWACIVKLLGSSRTQHMIKNRYNSLISKVKKNKKKREEELAQMVYKSLETQVKIEKREKRNKNETLFETIKNIENQQSQNQAQSEKCQKSEIFPEQKSDHSTFKSSEIKVEEEVASVENALELKSEYVDQKVENNIYQTPVQGFYPYGCEYMGMNPFQLMYFYHPSAFMPVNQIYSGFGMQME